MQLPILPVYNRVKLSFTHGKGSYLYNSSGDAYLDFGSGVAVNALGHAHPAVTKALIEQAQKLWHVSNIYEIPQMMDLAKLLVDHSFADRVFFCNSGTEAMECLIKMVRKYHHHYQTQKTEIITFENAFHGRTLAAVSASNRPSCMEGFEPKVQGFKKAIFADIKSVKEIISSKTAAILIEPIQGEGGVNVADTNFFKELRLLADQYGALLCFDEIQTGVGRTGSLYYYEQLDIKPDIMTSAKGIGNGFPLGVCMATEEVGQVMTPGTHGSTYGGNPLAMAVGNAVLEEILAEGFLRSVEKKSQQIWDLLHQLHQKYPNQITAIRGKGLMIGIECKKPVIDIAAKLREYYLLTVPAGNNVLRILPPLTISADEIQAGVSILEEQFGLLTN